MIRLTLMTLIGLFAVWTLYGDPAKAPPAAEPKQEVRREPVIPADASAGPVIIAADVQQTPEQSREFPGPPLRPSPEYVGTTEQAEAQLAAGEGAEILYVAGDRVNFRGGPSTNDQVIGALLRGSPIEALGRTEDGWVHLRDAQGREGYMSAQFLSAEQPR